MCSQQIIRVLQKTGCHLTGTFKNHVDLVLRIIGSGWKDIKLFMLDRFYLQKANKLSKLNQSISPVKIT